MKFVTNTTLDYYQGRDKIASDFIGFLTAAVYDGSKKEMER